MILSLPARPDSFAPCFTWIGSATVDTDAAPVDTVLVELDGLTDVDGAAGVVGFDVDGFVDGFAGADGFDGFVGCSGSPVLPFSPTT